MAFRIVEVNDLMQHGYSYELSEPTGKNFAPGFKPEITPQEMLELGVFGGKYMTDCRSQFPHEWFARDLLCAERSDPTLNYFGVSASKPLSFWQAKTGFTWRTRAGWFSGMAGISLGRSIDDERQVKRRLAMRRHLAQLRKHCIPLDMDCRRRQRQAPLHWAYDTGLI